MWRMFVLFVSLKQVDWVYKWIYIVNCVNDTKKQYYIKIDHKKLSTLSNGKILPYLIQNFSNLLLQFNLNLFISSKFWQNFATYSHKK